MGPGPVIPKGGWRYDGSIDSIRQVLGAPSLRRFRLKRPRLENQKRKKTARYTKLG